MLVRNTACRASRKVSYNWKRLTLGRDASINMYDTIILQQGKAKRRVAASSRLEKLVQMHTNQNHVGTNCRTMVLQQYLPIKDSWFCRECVLHKQLGKNNSIANLTDGLDLDQGSACCAPSLELSSSCHTLPARSQSCVGNIPVKQVEWESGSQSASGRRLCRYRDLHPPSRTFNRFLLLRAEKYMTNRIWYSFNN